MCCGDYTGLGVDEEHGYTIGCVDAEGNAGAVGDEGINFIQFTIHNAQFTIGPIGGEDGDCGAVDLTGNDEAVERQTEGRGELPATGHIMVRSVAGVVTDGETGIGVGNVGSGTAGGGEGDDTGKVGEKGYMFGERRLIHRRRG